MKWICEKVMNWYYTRLKRIILKCSNHLDLFKTDFLYTGQPTLTRISLMSRPSYPEHPFIWNTAPNPGHTPPYIGYPPYQGHPSLYRIPSYQGHPSLSRTPSYQVHPSLYRTPLLI